MSSNGNSLGNGKNGKKRRRRILWAAIAVVVLGGGGYGVKAALSPSRTIDPSKLASVERGDLARVVVATGKIQPLSKVEVKSKASGIVKKLYVDYGDRVKQGQLLAELDKVQLQAAERAFRANLQAAEAALDSAKATLERNKVDAEGPDVRQRARHGAHLDPELAARRQCGARPIAGGRQCHSARWQRVQRSRRRCADVRVVARCDSVRQRRGAVESDGRQTNIHDRCPWQLHRAANRVGRAAGERT